MEILGCLYFAICFSIVGIGFFFFVGLNLWGISHRHSMWRFSKWGIINLLWIILFAPCAIVSSMVAVVFWSGVFWGGLTMENYLAPKNNMAHWKFEFPEDTERKLEIAGKILTLRRAIRFHSRRPCKVETLKRDLERLERRLRFLDSA